MKTIREYHIESYWAEKTAKQERKAELKQKFFDMFLIGAFFVLNIGIGIELLKLAFEVI